MQLTPSAATRRERWTYRNNAHSYPVAVAVRGDDYRATVAIAGALYSAGRNDGTPWRADANGIAHATRGDIQGDAVDRLPRALFPFAAADCAVAGESTDPVPSWVVVDRAPHDKPHWFWIDERSGRVVREVTREGRVVTTLRYDAFAAGPAGARPLHWTVAGGDPRNDLDVSVEAVTPAPIQPADVAPPSPAPLFVPSVATGAEVPVPVAFSNGQVTASARVNGRTVHLILDTGTQSIMLDAHVVKVAGSTTVLDHAIVDSLSVGDLAARRVSVMSLPLGFDGILGYDFFVGRVVHFDYRHERVEVLSRAAAEPVFADPRVAVMAADYSEGLPLVSGRVGQIWGDRFALDTGSYHLFFFSPFAQAVAPALSGDRRTTFPWSGRSRETEGYLEGDVALTARWVDLFALGSINFTNLIAGVEEPPPAPDQIEIPFDGIVGTDELRPFDVWFDVDGGRVGFRG